MTVVDDQFDELFRREWPSLVAVGSAMTGSVDAAKDLAQETMVRALQQGQRLYDFDQPSYWLRRVMSNLIIDRHRRSGAEARALHRVDSPAEATAVGTADSWAQLLELLPPRQRVLVALHYGEDLSLATIADMLQITIGTVKSSLHKARQTVREELERNDNVT